MKYCDTLKHANGYKLKPSQHCLICGRRGGDKCSCCAFVQSYLPSNFCFCDIYITMVYCDTYI